MKETTLWKQRFLLALLAHAFLLPFIVYFLFQSPETKPFDLVPKKIKVASSPSNKEEIQKLETLSYKQLVSRLKDKTLLEEGYRRRDLALSLLVQREHFDVEGALKRPMVIQKSVIEGRSVGLVSGLKDRDYQTIRDFAHRERWPLTALGLFLKLKNKKEKSDHTLTLAFFSTRQFQEIERLFAKTYPLDKKVLLTLLISGSYRSMAYFGEMAIPDLQRRRRLLLHYSAHGSSIAAALLLKSDLRFAYKQLDDPSVVRLLAILPRGKLSQRYAQALLGSPRSDSVKSAALAFLRYGIDPTGMPGMTAHNSSKG